MGNGAPPHADRSCARSVGGWPSLSAGDPCVSLFPGLVLHPFSGMRAIDNQCQASRLPSVDPVSIRRLRVPPVAFVPNAWLVSLPFASRYSQMYSHLPRCRSGAGVEAFCAGAGTRAGPWAAGTRDGPDAPPSRAVSPAPPPPPARTPTLPLSPTSATLLPSPLPSSLTSCCHFLFFSHLLF